MVCNLLVQRGQHGAIGIHGQGDAAVAEQLLHHLRVHALPHDVGGGGMSQVVRPDAREVGAFERTVLRFDSLRVLLSATTRIAGEIERKYMTVGPLPHGPIQRVGEGLH
jgi:hypothetical protein